MKNSIRHAAYLFAIITILVILNSIWVEQQTKDKIFSQLSDVPARKTGLLLGTSPILSDGSPNPYYTYRIEAAIKLFKAGKIEHILVSGDNGTHEYNEPAQIQADLLAGGIPDDRVHLDYAGFRTLDSVVRAKEVFGQQSLICISQPFHNQRAIAIGIHKKIDVIGFNAHDVAYPYNLRVQLREYLARVKMRLDLWLGVAPKYLGTEKK
ncbi:MAG: ElyC/SanA/YdcF family protein [Saprospiraceae bacterium]